MQRQNQQETSANSRGHSPTSKKFIRADVKKLLNETVIRYPSQEIEKETLDAWLDDWESLAQEVGLSRFAEGLKRCWSYCEFFPRAKNIRELLPAAPLTDGEKWNRDLKEMMQRKAAGERFYTLADVFLAVAEKINKGELRPTNEKWLQWAKGFSGSAAKKKAAAQKAAEQFAEKAGCK